MWRYYLEQPSGRDGRDVLEMAAGKIYDVGCQEWYVALRAVER